MSETDTKPNEETTTPKTEEPVKITTEDKKKSPGRVEWAKKLNALSQQAKRDKKQGKQTNKKLESIKETTEKDLTVDKSSNNYLIAISIGGLLIGGLGLYYQRKTFNKETVDPQPASVSKKSVVMME